MAVSAVAAGASPQTNPFAETRQAFSQLSSALQSGNLSAAQSAYNTLSSSPLAQNGPFASAIQQIGQDLQSGNLSDAQSALSSLQQLQTHRHHHHGAKPAAQSQTSSTTQPNDPDGDSDGSSTPVAGIAASSTAATGTDQTVNITA